MPVCAGVAGCGIQLRRRSERARFHAERKADASSVEQRAGDERSAAEAEESVCGAQDRTELGAGQGKLVPAPALAGADTVPAAGRGATRQQHRRKNAEESDPASEECALLQDD